MNKYKHSKAGLFLMEIMINILFFSVLVTICLQLFFKAHNLSESTTSLHRAVTTCTSIAEIFQSSEVPKEALLTFYPDAVSQTEQIILYFDKNFASCKETNAVYQAIVTLTDSPLHTALIEFMETDSTDIIYSLSTFTYHQTVLSSVSGGGNHE